ncbi:kinase-like protein [Obba rivulosa]|uniref:Kinase-like protein n=1 Tax=Obba rivulosa TaxID=1052685 RepID=A0A8E2AVY1_9APHY|nr:kinase-like protein [Obba rivulosa]
MRPYQTFCKEAIVWKHLQNPNIVPFHGVDETTFPSQLALVSDWMPPGTLADYLNENPAADRLKLASDIVRGLKYLHEVNLCTEISRGNTVLVSEQHVAYVTDFGLAAMHYSHKLATVSLTAGSVRWMSPELIDPEAFELDRAELFPQSDIDALSMVLWEIFTGFIPFYQYERDAAVIRQILRGIRPQRPLRATSLGPSDAIWALMEACWQTGWQQRPDAATVLNWLEDEFEDGDRGVPDEWPLSMN